MSNQPLVSVLMTAYNREKYIAAAIESVLASTYENFELIIVDDRSKDNTVDIAQKFSLKDPRVKVYVNEKNLGDYLNRNKAASHANGKYIKYLDADDLIYHYNLEAVTRYMEQNPESGFALGSIRDDNKPFPIFHSPKESYLEHFLGFGHFDRSPGSGFIKLEAFNKVGGFSGKRMIGDYEFWFKIARYYPMITYPIDFYWNRQHEEQESRSSYAKDYAALKKNVLEEALTHPDCPLNKDELAMIRKHIKNSNRKKVVKAVIGSTKKLFR